MRILVACESSGIVRETFRRKGHDAWSCDTLPADDGSPFHIQDDVLNHLGEGWDLMIAHPPCTDLTVACSRLWPQKQADGRQGQALDFVLALMKAPINKICIENPVGAISTFICKPDQIIQPYWYGEDASKKTCLWLKNLEKLPNGQYCNGRVTPDGKVRWSNQTDSGQNRLTPGPNRWKERSKTYQGIADMMMETWG